MAEEAPVSDAPASDADPAGAAPDPAGAPAAPAAGAGLDIDALQAELRRARDEAAENRVSRRKYEQAFEGLEPDEVDTYLGMVKLLMEDPKAAHKKFSEVSSNIERTLREQGLWEEAEAAAGPKFLTEEDLERREREREQERQIQSILTEAKTLGYEPDTAEHSMLLWMAAKDPETGGSIQKAHEKITSKLQAVIDAAKEEAVKEYIEAAKNGASKWPPVGDTASGTPGDPVNAPRDLAAAKRSAIARLSQLG